MIQKIVESFGVTYMEGLTGFKWIAKMIKDFPELKLIGGGEESFGYMVGDFVRDKDAVTATLLICEIAAQKKAEGSSIYAYLQEIYTEFGYYQEKLVSMVKKGKAGAEEIQGILMAYRNNPPLEIAGSKVICIEDYKSSISKNILKGSTSAIEIPKSNVIIFYTEDGSKIAVRPSGTEPKIKFYISVNDKKEEGLQEKIAAIIQDLKIY
jgi:phosphomannomutase